MCVLRVWVWVCWRAGQITPVNEQLPPFVSGFFKWEKKKKKKKKELQNNVKDKE